MESSLINKKEIDFYHNNGYLAIDNVLSNDEVSELQSVTDFFLEKSRNINENNEIYDLENGHSYDSPNLRRLKNPIELHEVYNKTIRHKIILDIISQLIGPNIIHFGNKLNMKSPFIGSPVQWHQDWAFYPHTNDDVLAVGVCIDEMTVENGSLLVIPESHTGPILDHHQNGKFCGAVTEPAFNGKKSIPLELSAGGITIHHARLLHGSGENNSDKSRRLLLFQYSSSDAWPLIPQFKENSWNVYKKNLLRGTILNQPRLENVPVRLPYPAAERTGSIYESQSILKSRYFN